MIKATIGKLGFNMVRILPECDCVDLASLKSHYVFSDDHQAILCEKSLDLKFFLNNFRVIIDSP
ncbi:hypothetical protein XM75_u0127 [Vibrio vulnificus]|nr:hypothetical protein XM75_u0127 [Vibrio vulnificus]